MKNRQKILSVISRDNNLSEFEKKVYGAVLNIPSGQTRSYKWIAQFIKRPRSYRAVGNALNKNPYVGMVPCHRVIRIDGSVGGYSRGISLKKRILKAELIDAGLKRCYNRK